MTVETTAARIAVDFAGPHQTTYRGDVWPVGMRIRSTVDPTLTGVIKQWEYNRPGVLSPVPYCIGWDDSGLAHDILGIFFVYSTDFTIEPIEVPVGV